MTGFAQETACHVQGSVLDENDKAMAGATAALLSLADSSKSFQTVTDAAGAFQFHQLAFGYYRLRISFIGYNTKIIDSVYLHAAKPSVNLGELGLKLSQDSSKLDEVVIYLEKPLIQSRDGNITFNAGESPLSAGSSASELLTNVPLITKDPNGKLLVRGKEPKVLIDDKPVELNLQQLQDLLESMPGSSIDKIEVMTNPPPQYANEQGGVINIVTKKGSVGKSGRLSASYGTRGEAVVNASYNYRKSGLAVSINTGANINRFAGNGSSERENLYSDSTNFFLTSNEYRNKSLRPNFRANVTYDINKFHSVNIVLQHNQNHFENVNSTRYTNLNRFKDIYRQSIRTVNSRGDNYSPNINLSYTLRTKRAGESLRAFINLNYSDNDNSRDFNQQFLNVSGQQTGLDSLQQQNTSSQNTGSSVRVSYDRPLGKKDNLSLGGFNTLNRSDVDVDAEYFKRPENTWKALPFLSNDFRFKQGITNLRASIKHSLRKTGSFTVGVNAEHTNIRFDLYTMQKDTSNAYWSLLPFFNLSKNWKTLNLTLSYRQTLRRPGINELNPTIDFTDPYNIRFGNPGLLPSKSHNIDFVLGKTVQSSYFNLALGTNFIEDIYSQVRTLRADGVTEISWQNISGRREYELSTWSGFAITKQMRVNVSGGVTYNAYSEFDKQVRRFRNGTSFNSNVNAVYTWKQLYTATTSFTYNRFANPQGTVRGNLNTNFAFQAKMFKRKMTAGINVIDPFVQQKNRTFTRGTNFALSSFSTTQTRNLRFTLAYNFSKAPKKSPIIQQKKR